LEVHLRDRRRSLLLKCLLLLLLLHRLLLLLHGLLLLLHRMLLLCMLHLRLLLLLLRRLRHCGDSDESRLADGYTHLHGHTPCACTTCAHIPVHAHAVVVDRLVVADIDVAACIAAVAHRRPPVAAVPSTGL
jgi:hypothetical protein